MKETTFKILTYCGQYVDANLLEKGIYVCNKPHLYSSEDTIEILVERAIKMQTQTNLISERYINNLKRCQLTHIQIVDICD